MANTPWQDGNGVITISPSSGTGDGTISVSSEANDGIDRERTITVNAGGISQTVKVIQAGLRELFYAYDTQFGTLDDDNFAVLK